jgi:hypothetical protein
MYITENTACISLFYIVSCFFGFSVSRVFLECKRFFDLTLHIVVCKLRSFPGNDSSVKELVFAFCSFHGLHYRFSSVVPPLYFPTWLWHPQHRSGKFWKVFTHLDELRMSIFSFNERLKCGMQSRSTSMRPVTNTALLMTWWYVSRNEHEFRNSRFDLHWDRVDKKM